MIKCIDGECRKACNIAYSSCSHDKPLRCADGRCVGLIQECASVRCGADAPFLCPDGTCKATLSFCKYPSNIRIILGKDLNTLEGFMPINLSEQNGRIAGTLYTHQQLHLKFKGLAMSQLTKTKLDISNAYDPLFNSFFSKSLKDIKPQDFIRSAIISISTNAQDDKIKYKKPILLNLNADFMKQKKHFGNASKNVN